MANQVAYRQGIKSWAEEDRPREKLLIKGREALSEAELIAALIGSGTPTFNAVEVARSLLRSVGYDLNVLAKLSIKDLTKHRGIGLAKAISIVAAIELGRRRKHVTVKKATVIKNSDNAFEFLKGDLMDLPHEEFWIILVNRAKGVIKKQRISKGGVSGTVADPKIIYKIALEELASGLIVAHNHPSGSLSPSKEDILLTKRLRAAGKTLGIELLDHLIIGEQKYVSLADEGLLPAG